MTLQLEEKAEFSLNWEKRRQILYRGQPGFMVTCVETGGVVEIEMTAGRE